MLYGEIGHLYISKGSAQAYIECAGHYRTHYSSMHAGYYKTYYSSERAGYYRTHYSSPFATGASPGRLQAE